MDFVGLGVLLVLTLRIYQKFSDDDLRALYAYITVLGK